MTGYYIAFAAGVIVSIGMFVAFKTVNKKRKQMGNTSLNKAANVLLIVFILFTVATAGIGSIVMQYGVWDIANAIKVEARQREIDAIGGIPENPDFRNVTWGMTRETVELLEEKDSLTDMGNVIEMCGVRVVDYYANPFYCFDDNNRLWRAGYTFIRGDDRSEAAACIRKYENLVEALSAKYGEGKDGTHWENDYYKDKPNKWETALSMGNVTFNMYWETPNSEIWLDLHYDNGLYLRLYYDSLTYTRVDEPAAIDTNGL